MIEFREYGLKNRVKKIDAVACSVLEVLEQIYGDELSLFINENGEPSGYIRIYCNDTKIENVNYYTLSNGDVLKVITAMSGG